MEGSSTQRAWLPAEDFLGDGKAWLGLDWRALPYPAFVVTVNRFGGPTPAGLNVPGQVSFREAWNSFLRSAVDLPTPGCWEITGRLPSHQELRFVVWVEP